MNIKELKEAISKLPDDMPVILGSYYRNNRHKPNLNEVGYTCEGYCKDNDAHGYEAAVYSDQEYEELKQEEYEQYKFDLEEGEHSQKYRGILA
jgi:hypothetical protein